MQERRSQAFGSEASQSSEVQVKEEREKHIKGIDEYCQSNWIEQRDRQDRAAGRDQRREPQGLDTAPTGRGIDSDCHPRRSRRRKQRRRKSNAPS